MWRINVAVDTSGLFLRNDGALQRRFEDMTPATEWVCRTMRFGPGSITDQFNREAEGTQFGYIQWPRTKPFGNRPAPAKTLQRTGSLLRAWQGTGPGSLPDNNIGGNTFVVGVDTTMFPGAGVFQGYAPAIVRPKKQAKTRKGSAMRYYLGKAFGVWISEARLQSGLVIPNRRVNASPEMRARVADILARWLIGEAPNRTEASLAA